MRTINVNVTTRDTKYGKPHSATACAVFRAMKRVANVRTVGVTTVGLIVGRRSLSLRLPKFVTTQILLLDDGKPVKPFTFKLTVP